MINVINTPTQSYTSRLTGDVREGASAHLQQIVHQSLLVLRDLRQPL